MQTIKLNETLAESVLSGKKTLTIREGAKPYESGEAEFVIIPSTPPTGFKKFLSKLQRPRTIRIFVETVHWAKLGRLPEEYVAREGYETLDQVVAALKVYYPNISKDSNVTVLAFRVRD